MSVNRISFCTGIYSKGVLFHISISNFNRILYICSAYWLSTFCLCFSLFEADRQISLPAGAVVEVISFEDKHGWLPPYTPPRRLHMDSSCHHQWVRSCQEVWHKLREQFPLARGLWKRDNFGQCLHTSLEINDFSLHQHADVCGGIQRV